jgi:hypothetical protein
MSRKEGEHDFRGVDFQGLRLGIENYSPLRGVENV